MAEDREVLHEVDAEAVLRAESAKQKIVRVEAGSIVVEADGANDAPVVNRQGEQERAACVAARKGLDAIEATIKTDTCTSQPACACAPACVRPRVCVCVRVYVLCVY